MTRSGVVFLIGLVGVQPVLSVPISLSQLGITYTQDFNTLASSGSSSSLPQGWVFVETGNNANGLYSAGTGSSNTGDTYSFGTTGDSDRALGGLRSVNLVPLFGVEFRNNTGSTIISLSISYRGEQWRLGASGRQDRLDFQYSLDATTLTDGTWTDVDTLDFLAPDSKGTAGARNGNASAYRTQISGSIGGLNVSPGASFWLRWVDFDASGADDGLAVDDFSLTAYGPAAANPVSDTGRTSLLCLLGLASLAGWVLKQGLVRTAPFPKG